MGSKPSRFLLGFAGAMLVAANGVIAAPQTSNQQGQRSPSSNGPPPSTLAAAAAQPSTQGDLGRPYTLPAASRARMHQCGIEWHKMKMSGEAADNTWRVFASVCLATGSEKNPVGSDAALGPLVGTRQ